MNQFLLAFAALSLCAVPVSLCAVPVLAQPLSSEAMAKQSQAIAIRVQRQLMACWALPPGHEGMRVSLDIAFLGSGALDATPELSAESRKSASKHPALAQSVLAAVERCTPFAGLEALGAGPDERFSVTIHFQS